MSLLFEVFLQEWPLLLCLSLLCWSTKKKRFCLDGEVWIALGTCLSGGTNLAYERDLQGSLTETEMFFT